MAQLSDGLRERQNLGTIAQYYRACDQPEMLRAYGMRRESMSRGYCRRRRRRWSFTTRHRCARRLTSGQRLVARSQVRAGHCSRRHRDAAGDASGVIDRSSSAAPMSCPSPLPRARRRFRTVLFTDLVGHTEMMSRLGDERGRDVLREHERITRES